MRTATKKRAAEVFLEQLEQLPDLDFDPEVAGRQAAVAVAAGHLWSELVGPFTDSAGAAAALGGVSKQAVSQRVAAGTILGLRLAGNEHGSGRLVYPTWQFRGSTLRFLATVLSTAGFDPERPVTGWTIAAWLTTPDDALESMTPAAMLRAGHVAPVLAAAADVAESLGTAERSARRAPTTGPTA